MRKIFFILVIAAGLTSVDSNAQKTLVQDLATIFEHGDIVSSNDGTLRGTLSLSSQTYDTKIVGVYVQMPKRPEIQGGEPVLLPKGNIVVDNGIVQVKYNSENGPIRSGDPIAASSTPGVAMKATSSGIIIGIATEDASVSSGLINARILIQYIDK